MDCPTCHSTATLNAGRCTRCGFEPRPTSNPDAKPPQSSLQQIERDLRFILPVGLPPLALTAGYLGLFSILILPAPFALICGLLGLRQLKRHPDRYPFGRGRCWTGIILGMLFSLLGTFMLIMA